MSEFEPSEFHRPKEDSEQKEPPESYADDVSDLVAQVASDASTAQEGINRTAIKQGQLELARLKYIHQVIDLKGKWSTHLIVALWITIAFQVVMSIVTIALGALHRPVNTAYAIVITTGNFAQILVLCFLVVAHLFPVKNLRELSETIMQSKSAKQNED